jgi:hypothetical protein
MRRFVTRLIAACFVAGACSFVDVPSVNAGAVAGDIGSTISVGVSSPGSGGGPSGNGEGSSQAGVTAFGNGSSHNGSGNGGNSDSSGSSSPPPCVYRLAPASDQTAMGPPGTSSPGKWYLVECLGAAELNRDGLAWVPSGAPPATPVGAPPNPGVDPALVAQQAENSMRLPSPQIETNPTTRAVVNLPTWLWLDQGAWTPESVSASVGTVTATATATPERVQWTMGDGGSVVCEGPGTPYQPSVPAQSQVTNCSYTYGRSSAGEPSPTGDPNDAGFPVTATITWGVTWTAQGVQAGGVLNPLTTSSSTSLPVEQIQSVSADSQTSTGGAP